MPQSHHHQCSCCMHHHRHVRPKQYRSRRDDDSDSDSSADSDSSSDVHVKKLPLVKSKAKSKSGAKPEAKEPEEKKPEERPWALWMMGDSGQYYYRGRQKPTGEWEYQFMPAYSNPPQKYTPSSYSTTGSTITYSTAPSSLPTSSASSYQGAGSTVTMPSSYATSQISSAMSSLSLYPQSMAALSTPPPLPQQHSGPTTSSALKHSWPADDEPTHRQQHKERKHVRVTEKSFRGPPHHHHHHHHHSRYSSSSDRDRRIGTMVSAEKDKRISPRSRVDGWLDDVEEGAFEGGGVW